MFPTERKKNEADDEDRIEIKELYEKEKTAALLARVNKDSDEENGED